MNFDYSNTDKSTMKTFKELLYQRKERKKKMWKFSHRTKRVKAFYEEQVKLYKNKFIELKSNNFSPE
jgi:predicted ATPase